MAKELINEIVDIAAIEKQYNAAKKMVDDLTKSIAGLSSQGISISGVKNVKDSAKEIDELAKSEQKLADIQKQIAAANTDRYKAEQQLLQVRKEQQNQAKLQAQAANEEIGAFKRLEAAYSLAAAKARDMAAAHGVDSKEAKESIRVS